MSILDRMGNYISRGTINTLTTSNNKLQNQLKESNSTSSYIREIMQSMEDQLQKTQLLINPISFRKTYVRSGGEIVTFLPESYDFFIGSMLGNSTSRPMINARKQELTRNGIELVPNFQSKCPYCAIEYEQIMEICDECDYQGDFILPDQKERDDADDWIDDSYNVNNNNQNIYDIVEMTLEYVDIVDDGWWVIEKDYLTNNGYIIDSEPKEIWVIHPANIAWSVDEHYKIGRYELTCLYHRDVAISQKVPDPVCSKDGCDSMLHPVVAVRYLPGTQNIMTRYIEGEVLHGSLYRPSALNGYPPALTLQYELSLTTNQMKFMSDYYDDVNYHKLPGYLLIPTTDSWKTVWEETKEMRRQLRMDPHSIGVLPFDPTGTGAKPEFVRFDTTPKEMEFIAVRDESRMRMSAFYGVSPIMQADVSGGGGLNNEGLQITVTNRAIAKAQQFINRKFLTPISKMLGLKDWKIQLKSNEEQDEVAIIDRKNKMADYGLKMVQLGFGVKLTAEGELAIVEKAEEEEDPYMGLFNQTPETPEEPSETNGKSSDQYQGAPATPDIKVKMYKFNETYPDWPWKDTYDIIEFRMINLSEVIPHPDSEITEKNLNTERVRTETLIYYLTQTDEMPPLIVDQNYKLLDGHHRKYVLDIKKQEKVMVAIVEAKEPEISEESPEDKRKSQVKSQLRAPSGGVNIQGNFYSGGRFIPADVQAKMTEAEKQAIREGKILVEA